MAIKSYRAFSCGCIFWHILALIILMPQLSPAQGYFDFEGRRQKESIDFQYYRNLIIIPVFINGHGPYHFILDTGVNFLIITNPSLKKDLHLKTGKAINIRGLGAGNDIEAFVTGDLSLDIGHLHGSSFAAAIFPEELIPFSSYVGMQIDGIIGNDLFRQFLVSIDYENHRLTIRAPGSWKPSRHYQSDSLDVISQRPYMHVWVKLKSGTEMKLKLIVDTGAGHPLLLEPGSAEGISLPAGGVEARIGVGLNGPIEGLLSRVSQIHMGTMPLSSVICSYPVYSATQSKIPPDERNGNIGNGVLDHFKVVFDYPDGKIFFKKSAHFRRRFDYDMSGLDFLYTGPGFSNYVVSGVDPGSPAERAGLKEQDILLFINSVPASSVNSSDFDEMLRSGDGNTIQLMYQRKGKLGFATIRLHRRV